MDRVEVTRNEWMHLYLYLKHPVRGKHFLMFLFNLRLGNSFPNSSRPDFKHIYRTSRVANGQWPSTVVCLKQYSIVTITSQTRIVQPSWLPIVYSSSKSIRYLLNNTDHIVCPLRLSIDAVWYLRFRAFGNWVIPDVQ